MREVEELVVILLLRAMLINGRRRGKLEFADRRSRLSSFLLYRLHSHSCTMRQKRAKAYKKLMHMYTMTYGFRTPYQVLGVLI